MAPTTRRCAVLGDPIAHSLSPTLHRAGYAELGLDWEYAAHRVGAGGLPEFLASLRQQSDHDWRGLSLTMPLKREAVALVGEISERARLAGAVNTIVFDDQLAGDVVLYGDNTDIPGAIAAIRERTTAPLSSAVIIGGGATATSLGLALADLGVRHLEIVVRATERAYETAETVARHPGRPEVTVRRLDELTELTVDLVVSTIPASAQDARLVAACSGVPTIFDVLYDPWPTPLAASIGDRVLVGGLDLLVHQAVVQFELFTGEAAPVSAMRAAGEQALADRAAV